MKIKTIFFDLDGTLYPHNNGMWSAISENMNSFMKNRLNIPIENITSLRETYFKEYGTTLRGLQDNFKIDTEEYLEKTHDIPLDQYLEYDHNLDTILELLPQKKWVFTNSDFRHSSRVLKALGIEKHFDGIIDVWATDFRPKPESYAFHKALEISSSNSTGSCMFFDDIPKNLITAKSLGIKTVLVGDNIPNNYSDFHISSVHKIIKEIPILLNNNQDI